MRDVVLYSAAEDRTAKHLAQILARMNFEVLSATNANQGEMATFWKDNIAPLPGSLIVYGEARVDDAKVLRSILDRYSVDLRAAPISSDADPFRIYRKGSNEEKESLELFWREGDEREE